MDEFLVITDEKNNPVGMKLRSAVHSDGDWHRVSHVWIFNSNGEILILKRAPNTEFYPNKYDVIIGGHVLYGENYVDTAIKELKEEIGLIVQPEDLTHVQDYVQDWKYPNKKNREFRKIFAVKFNGKISDIKTNEEVHEIKFVKIKKLKEMMKKEKNNFINVKVDKKILEKIGGLMK